MSKVALRLFIQEALPHPEKCFTGIRPLYKGDDDTEFGMCMQSVGVPPGIIKDEKGRGRLSTADPVDQMEEFVQNYKKWGEVGSNNGIKFQRIQAQQRAFR